MLQCNICKSPIKEIYKAKVLHKYDVQYYKCTSCGFIQTEKPYWLEEAYSSAITRQDIGLLYRNHITLPLLKTLSKVYFSKNIKMLDYGGGYGVLVRIMRDCGYDMYRLDKFCENIFAKGFDDENGKYGLLTAFEVFEHLENPIEEMKKMLQHSDHIFFSTEVQPHDHVTPENWWYMTPQAGQHVSLYSLKSLEILATGFGLNFYTNGINFHLFTRKKINQPLFKTAMRYKIARFLDFILPDPPSKLQEDYQLIKGGH
jgi:hypothetical protein